MEIVTGLLTAAAAAGAPITGLVLMGGMAYIIYIMVTKSRDYESKYETITTNHLHDLPNISEGLKGLSIGLDRIAESQERQERTLVALDSFLRARLNGGGHGKS